MILNKKQQISFISMCNSAMEVTHKNKKSDQQKNKATKSNGRTEKQITMVNKLEERKVKYSKNSETENYSSQCDTEIEEEEKEGKEDNKTEKVSFLTAMFEGKRYHDAQQREKQTPKRRRNRGRAAKEVDFKYQRRIDTFLKRKEVVVTGKPTPVKRKREEEKEKDIGMLITPKKRKDVQ